jgi:hypothetical protein
LANQKDLFMKYSKLLIAFSIAALGLGSSAFASGNYKLTCDDNNIFENPLEITIHGASATAEGNFSGPGDAIFNVNYRNLAVIDLTSQSKNDTLNGLTITQPRLVTQPVGFQLTLNANAKGVLVGELSMISTDSDKMDFKGKVECHARGL